MSMRQEGWSVFLHLGENGPEDVSQKQQIVQPGRDYCSGSSLTAAGLALDHLSPESLLGP